MTSEPAGPMGVGVIGALLTMKRIPEFFAAVSRKDLVAVGRDLEEDMSFEFPGGSTIAGRYDGRDAFLGFWERLFERYETFSLRPRRIALVRPYTVGLTNTALVEWEADAVTRDGLTAHANGVTVVDLRRGKLVRARDYIFDTTPFELIWGRRDDEQASPEKQPS